MKVRTTNGGYRYIQFKDSLGRMSGIQSSVIQDGFVWIGVSGYAMHVHFDHLKKIIELYEKEIKGKEVKK